MTRPLASRLASLLVVIGIVLGTAMVGTPAYARDFWCVGATDQPPVPENPNSGILAGIDGPLTADGQRKGVPGPYHDYGYAGTVWNTYNVTVCDFAFGTTVGGPLLGVAKWFVAVTNWSHYLVTAGSGALAPLDDAVRQGVVAAWNSVFVPWIGLVLVIVACLVLYRAGRGDLPRQAAQLAYAFLGLTIAALAQLAPNTWVGLGDQFIYDTTAQLKVGFLGGATADDLPSLLYDRVVVDSWIDGEFGVVDDRSRADARTLQSAQAFAFDELTNRNEAPQETFDTKVCQYGAIIKSTGSDTTDADMEPFEHCSEAEKPEEGQNEGAATMFSGRDASRIGLGFIALMKALTTCVLQLGANLTILVSLLMIRLIVIGLPIAAMVGILHNAYFATLVKIVGTALVNAFMLAGLAGAHALIVTAVFAVSDGWGSMFAVFLTLIISGLMWAVARPFRRLAELVRMTGEQGLTAPAGANDNVYAENRTVRSLARSGARRAGRLISTAISRS